MKKSLFFLIFFTVALTINAASIENETDTLRSYNLDEISVYSSKETNLLNAPVSSSLMDMQKIEQTQIVSIKDLSSRVPNFYMPDYGSAMSNSPYVRGVGSRYSGQSIALYIDNVPYLEKTAFDFELYDLAQIEVLRGPQGTLYGRNSIGGIINIYTLSPLDYQGTRVTLTGGNRGQLHAKASHYSKLSDKLGVSIGGYYGQHDGFYKNEYTGKMVDAEQTAGGRIRFDWRATQRLKLDFITDIDYVDQGAFPYGLYDPASGKTANPSFNDLSNYYRKTINNSLSGRYIWDKVLLTATLSHQYFDDQMDIDQDFTEQSIFTLMHKQKQHLLNGEVLLKSAGKSNYKWLLGFNAFGQNLDLDAPVSFKHDGIDKVFSPIFNPNGVFVLNETFDIPGTYDTERRGGAFFHQSTFDNLITEGLSLTLGGRIDADRIKMIYDAEAVMDLELRMGPKPIPAKIEKSLTGVADTVFIQFLPKAALKYEWGKSNFVYGSVARGYKTGGFNVQMVSGVLQDAMKPTAPEPDVQKETLYLPEVSWNYEVGLSHTFLNKKLTSSLTLFYMDISGLQLTEFIESGTGRMLTNAGKSVSKGVEFSTFAKLPHGFSIDLNYGYAHASFKHYSNIEKVNGEDKLVDYAGKIVPYAPQHTLSTNLNYNRYFTNSFISELYGTISWSGLGRIYWHESNDLYQKFYQLADARLGIKRKSVALELWGKNITNTDYNAFYFESFGNKFFQKGRPLQAGIRLNFEL